MPCALHVRSIARARRTVRRARAATLLAIGTMGRARRRHALRPHGGRTATGRKTESGWQGSNDASVPLANARVQVARERRRTDCQQLTPVLAACSSADFRKEGIFARLAPDVEVRAIRRG